MHEPHVPVLAEAVVRYAVPSPGARSVIDCTVGAGGHAAALLRAMGPAGRLLGIDRDPDALRLAADRLAAFGDQVRLVHGNFAELGEIVTQSGWGPSDAVVYDFGLSSMHVDRPERGFSYQHDAPLDMRMDTTAPLSAYDVVNTYDERHLARVIRSYGEERWASRIAQFIVAARKRRPIATTGELVEVIRAAVPSAARRVGPHPARRTFQALRLEVNKELEAIQASLPQASAELSPGGRLVALSYHSGEDRLVKRFMREEASGEAPRLRLLTRKPERPSEEEIARNPRASAARLRAAERLAAPPEPDGPPGGSVA
ncbi:MAG: 16S rRNA (cytosine(1402)-N(4))-methyltransferase RsmH [Actinobacteria bacterium]|nr:MAG: 16S rRNA (cytosine(1402)-N(4))-methyltransferase RsmH [Actinomycetota bacterium]